MNSAETNQINALDLASTATVVLDDAVLGTIYTLVADLKVMYGQGRRHRLAMGEKLYNLRLELSKPGYGTFKKTVKEELGMAYTTACDYINQYRESAGHYEIRTGDSNGLAVLGLSAYDPDATFEVPDDLNDGQPDAVDLAIALAKGEEGQALERLDNNREYVWKFLHLTNSRWEDLTATRKTLTQELAAELLILAAQADADTLTAAFNVLRKQANQTQEVK